MDCLSGMSEGDPLFFDRDQGAKRRGMDSRRLFWLSRPPMGQSTLGADSAALVDQSVRHADALTADVIDSIKKATETSRRVMERLKAEGDAEGADWGPLISRIDSLEQLLVKLTAAATRSPMSYHPASLISWCEILQRSFEADDPAV